MIPKCSACQQVYVRFSDDQIKEQEVKWHDCFGRQMTMQDKEVLRSHCAECRAKFIFDLYASINDVSLPKHEIEFGVSEN